ncbi:uncharacterized protein LOC133286105 [Gastrolobium bilobum]|uniref:uncharacterized protein LOC133286105 n=1 Tax=Gastrolobium bilobum TaxID=150636 RepID=UPI002AAFDCAA|nr:uncharacterized protein LOC133286105 [Gastrolobium bilobum]
MKRQRGVNVNGVKPTNPTKVEDVAAMGKKKAKKEAEQKGGKSVMEEEERNESRELVGGLLQGAIDSVMSWCWDEYMPPWLGGVVDEQMSWGSTWYPGWDMDFMGEAFSSLYSDVVWDDDIWNLKKEIPIPLDRKRFDW